MNVCILTQPLGSNYGGLLQAYALQKTVSLLGHSVTTEDIRPPQNISFLQRVKTIIKKYLLGQKEQIVNINPYFIQPATDFRKNYIKTTKSVAADDYSTFYHYNFDAYIVGSDQVWRPLYSYNIKHYFLDFLKSTKAKRIAYAASFGTDQWEFGKRSTRICSKLAKKFDFISVRETSGIELCKTYLGVKAEYVLDPTLLLYKDDYVKLFERKKQQNVNKTLITYILDYSEEKKRLIEYVVSEKKSINKLELKKDIINMPSDSEEQMFSVEEWLEKIYNAEFVITDSFHGTVFSILFNKQFIVIGNKERGNTRIESILNLLGLEMRFTQGDISEVRTLLQNQIDYTAVNQKLDEKRKESLSYLKSYLQ